MRPLLSISSQLEALLTDKTESHSTSSSIFAKLAAQDERHRRLFLV